MLVVDDEPAIRRFLRASLDPAIYEVLQAETGEAGIRSVATENPAVVLLDLGLPDMDGLDVARAIREWSIVPIIVLSARGQEADKVAALDAGADDYLTKPFGVLELMARIRVALRHAQPFRRSEPVVHFGPVTVDLAQREVRRDGSLVHLTPNEFKLLARLVRDLGRVITHRQLLREVWGEAYAEETHYLRVYMAQLRQKLEVDPTQPRHFQTETGVGYRLRGDEDQES